MSKRKGIYTLPYLPVGSASTNSQHSASTHATPFMLCFLLSVLSFALVYEDFYFLFCERDKEHEKRGKKIVVLSMHTRRNIGKCDD